jgi:hypothetical protein
MSFAVVIPFFLLPQEEDFVYLFIRWLPFSCGEIGVWKGLCFFFSLPFS